MPSEPPNPAAAARDITEVPAVEIVTTVALHLMSSAALKVGLGAPPPDHGAAGNELAGAVNQPDLDLDEARTLISALAGLIVAAAPRLGTHHAAPLRDGLRSLQLAFREASPIPDAPG